MSNISVQSITAAARNTGLEITESQAKSILERHKQLVKEGNNLRREKARQIDECWNWFWSCEEE